jgi:LacI family transcriptional regulator
MREFGCTQQRLEGFCQVYGEAGRPVAPEYVINADFTFAGGARAVQRAVEEGMEFDAVFAHNDLSAVGALQALRQAARGGRAEADVALVGFDDIPLPLQAGYPLTTVHQPLREMGEAAASMLLDLLDETGQEPETACVIPTDLVIRRTAIA